VSERGWRFLWQTKKVRINKDTTCQTVQANHELSQIKKGREKQRGNEGVIGRVIERLREGSEGDTVYIYTVFLSSTAFSSRTLRMGKQKRGKGENKLEERDAGRTKHAYNHPGLRRKHKTREKNGKGERER